MSEPGRRLSVDVEVYKITRNTASACSSLSPEETVRRVNADFPRERPWRLSRARTFPTGEPNPCPCDTFSKSYTHTHYLMEC
jgi:hypothetical protein